MSVLFCSSMASAVSPAPLPSTAIFILPPCRLPGGSVCCFMSVQGAGRSPPQPAAGAYRRAAPVRRFRRRGCAPCLSPPANFPSPLNFVLFPAGQPHHVLPVRPQDQQRHHRGAPLREISAPPPAHGTTALPPGSAPAQLLWNQAKCIGCTAPAPPHRITSGTSRMGYSTAMAPHRAGNALAAPKAKIQRPHMPHYRKKPRPRSRPQGPPETAPAEPLAPPLPRPRQRSKSAAFRR